MADQQDPNNGGTKKIVGVYDRPANADKNPAMRTIIIVLIVLAMIAFYLLHHFHRI